MKKIIVVLLLGILCILPAFAGDGGEANPDLKTNAESLKKWQDMKFGMFIHWNPVSLRGTEIGWSRGREIPIEEFDCLEFRSSS